MVNCDSSIENHTKYISKLSTNNDYSGNFSSPNLPSISLSSKINNKRSNSSKKYISSTLMDIIK